MALEPSEAPYLKQTWGVFGQAYRSQLFEIGLLTRAEGDDIPRPSLEIGDAIVADFERALGDRTALFRAIAASLPLQSLIASRPSRRPRLSCAGRSDPCMSGYCWLKAAS